MAKLAEVTSEVRILLKLLAASFIVITILFLFFKGGTIAKNIFFPTPPAPPEEKFGKLPKIDFPTTKTDGFDYRINTLSGNLPSTGASQGQIPDRIKVYKVKIGEPSLIALSTARTNLRNVGFSNNETKLSESTYQWNNDSNETVQYNILNDNFRISSNFLTDSPPTRLSGSATTKEGAYESAVNFLSAMNEDVSDLDRSNSMSKYLRITDGQLVLADSQNNAQFIRIDLAQKDIGGLKMYYPGFDESLMYFIYRNQDDSPKVEEAKFIHVSPDLNDSSTYPIKSPQDAFEDLKSGKAMVFNNNKNNVIDITDVSLGYYLGVENQPYLLPIMVFSGKDFKAYVNVLVPSSIEN